MALYRYADQPYYFREDRAPRKTMINPSTNPISKPTRTLLINNPSSKPSTIAKINDISPRLTLGFLCVFIIQFPFQIKDIEQGISYGEVNDFDDFIILHSLFLVHYSFTRI